MADRDGARRGSTVETATRGKVELPRREADADARPPESLAAPTAPSGTLVGRLAHDFNNVLGAIVGFAELALADSADRPETAADLRDLLAVAHRGKLLVEHVLAFSGRHDAKRRPIDLAHAVAEAVQRVRSTIPAAIELRQRLATNLPRVAADRIAVQQVLTNLVTNSAHAMPAGGVVDIVVELVTVQDDMLLLRPELREGRYLLLTIKDTGIGMDYATRERAFEPCFTTRPAGLGLGLPLVQGIMRDHDGAVVLESESGEGTVVTCFFPVLGNEAIDDGAIAADTPRGNGERILYVDDEPSLAGVGQRRLVALGYVVTAEDDCRQALKTFRTDPTQFDLVVTDYSMPQMNGLNFARELVHIRPDIPVILLSGFFDELPVEALRAAGIRQFIKKPVTTDDLGVTVRTVLDTKKPTA